MERWSRWQDWVNVVAGAWLFLSPWVLGLTLTTAFAWSAWIAGVVIVAAALWALSSPKKQAAEWVAGIAGLWSLLSPWIAGFAADSTAAWNSWIVGIIVTALAVWVIAQPW